MGYGERRALYRAIGRAADAAVIAYATGDRPGMQAQVSPEAVELVVDHLEAIGPVPRLALVLMTDGGSSAAAWRLARLLRAWAGEIEVWVPARALSAGTMIAIGANRIVMARSAVLGPIDPSLIGPLGPAPAGGGGQRVPVSVEAVTGYLEAARETLDITDDQALAQILVHLASNIHPLVLGQVFRSREQARAMAFRLLEDGGMAEAKRARIADFLCSETGSHDYTIGRAEAAELGLPVVAPEGRAERALARVRADMIAEFEARTPFVPEQLMVCAGVASVPYRSVRALVESVAHGAHHYVSEGELSRAEDGSVRDRRRCDGWRKTA
jgi:hypothetical protein